MNKNNMEKIYKEKLNKLAKKLKPFINGLNNEEYQEILEGGFISPETLALSSFSLDSSSYAYTNLRRLINNNSYYIFTSSFFCFVSSSL